LRNSPRSTRGTTRSTAYSKVSFDVTAVTAG
jgi:hypothetical protein